MKRLILLVLLLPMMLASCDFHANKPSGGEPLMPDQQMSLYEELHKGQSDPDVSFQGMVYWTPTGEKYHKDSQCSHLKNASEVLSGSLKQAINHGASSPCSRCGG